MKTLSILFLATVGSGYAYACSPPPDLTYVQPAEINAVVSSIEVLESLRAIGGKNIESISQNSRGYLVKASNGCYVVASIEYSKATSAGMCPSLESVKILESTCKL